MLMWASVKSRRSDFLFWCFVLILFALAFRNMLGWGMQARGDSPAFPETAMQAFDSYYYAWQPMNRGMFPLNANFVIIGALIALCGGNAVLAQKIYLLIWMPTAFVAMYFFLERIIHVNSRFARFIGSFLYAVNSLVISAFIGGVMGFLREYALFPLLLFFIFRISKQQDMLRSTLLFSLLFTFMFIFDKRVTLLSIPFVIVAIARNLKPKNLKVFGVVLLSFLLAFSLFLVLNLPSIYAEWGAITKYTTPNQQAEFEEIISEITYTYSSLDFSPSPFIVMLSGQEVNPPARYLDYGSTRWLLVSLIILGFAFASLLLEKDRRKLAYALCFSVLAISISGFMILTYWGYTLELFRRFPFLLLYRSPSVPSLMLGLPYGILIAITAESLINRSNVYLKKFVAENITIERSGQQEMKKPNNVLFHVNRNVVLHDSVTLLCVILTISVFAYNWPFFTGDMGIPQQRGSLPFLKQYTVPEHFYDAGKWLNDKRDTEFFRTIWLPWTYDEAEIHLRWIDPYTFSLPTGFSKYASTPVYDYMSFVYHDLYDRYKSYAAYGVPAAGEKPYLGLYLAPANIKYIVVNNKTLGVGWSTIGASGNPKIFSEILGSQADLKLVVENEEYSIYQNQQFIPHIGAYNNVIFVRDMNITDVESYGWLISTIPGLDLKKDIFVFENALKQNPLEQIAIEPDIVVSSLGSSKMDNLNLRRYVFIVPLRHTPTVFLRDDFENETFTLNSWSPKTSPDVWNIKNGEYVWDANSWEVSIINVTENFADVGLETKMTAYKPDSPTYQVSPAIFLRYIDANNFYRFYPDFRDNLATIVKKFNGTETILYDKSLKLELGKSYLFKAEAVGSNLRMYIDNKLIAEAKDESLYAGHVGVGSFESKTHFDDVVAYGLKWDQSIQFPINTNFKIGINGQGEGAPLFNVNNQTFKSTTTENIIGNYKFYETDIIKITDEGEKYFTVTYDNMRIKDPYLIIFPVIEENETLGQIFKSKNRGNTIINTNQNSPVEYEIEMESNEPTLIFLGEPFDKGWEAYVDREKYESFPTFSFGNGFYIKKTGRFIVRIKYAGQPTRTLMILISSFSFILVVAAIVFLSRMKILKIASLRTREKNRHIWRREVRDSASRLAQSEFHR